ncbi:MAG: hypothetical protein IKI20_09390 [Lachnospiraceae bacterium]|nr:hypothetical protein [Lachnospiraceae bacterium]
MDKVIILLVIFGLLAAVIIIGKVMEKNKERDFRKKLNRDFDKPLSKEYSRERKQSINGYFLRHADDCFVLDDITWNDFELDRFIKTFNHSYSSVGDEYYYARLRMPKISAEDCDFERLEEVIRYFSEDEKLREDYQVLMAKLGRSGKFSLYSYLDFLSAIPSDKPVITIIDWLLYLASIGMMFFSGLFYLGLILLILLVIVNIIVYLSRIRRIEPYFASFTYILRIIKTAEKTVKRLPDSFRIEKEKLIGARKKLSKISTANIVFLQSDNSSAVGDMGNGLLSFFKMFFQFDIFLFYRMKKQIENHGDAVDDLFETLGFLDFGVNVLSFRRTLQYYSVPEFIDQCGIHTTEMVHPLLLSDGVANSISTEKGVLLTGSNASGKSTFLRMIGLNAVLAQSLHTVYAKEYTAPLYRVYSSMSIRDNLESGESYYMAEIKSIKRILDAIQDESGPVLCFVDEVLRGTNTKERIAAGAEIMRSMQQKHTICFAATHDLELASILVPEFENYHFDEEIKDDDILFPYQLKKGYATSRNAIALLRIMGYPEDIVSNALENAGMGE